MTNLELICELKMISRFAYDPRVKETIRATIDELKKLCDEIDELNKQNKYYRENQCGCCYE